MGAIQLERFSTLSQPGSARLESWNRFVGGLFDGQGMPLVTGQATKAPGLYFCGQITSPTGQLREIGLEARRIAEDAGRYTARL